jgi:hypothetical protein
MESNDVILKTAAETGVGEEFLSNDNNNNKPHSNNNIIGDDYNEIKALKQSIHSSTTRLTESPNNPNSQQDLLGFYFVFNFF